eukprot:8503214-Alexandrium_andersonii.AAC.1
MSASLVGSEMCIRDSRHYSAGAPGGRSLEGSWGSRLPSGRGPKGLRPVSYTHLTLPTICSV